MGSGRELEDLISTQPGWRFDGVDPGWAILDLATQQQGAGVLDRAALNKTMCRAHRPCRFIALRVCRLFQVLREERVPMVARDPLAVEAPERVTYG